MGKRMYVWEEEEEGKAGAGRGAGSAHGMPGWVCGLG